MQNIIKNIYSNKKFILFNGIKFSSLAFRLIISLLFVNILSVNDFNLFLKISTISGLGLSFLTIFFQNLVLSEHNKKISFFQILFITAIVFCLIFLTYLYFYNNINEAIYIFIYLFTPLVYVFTLASSINGKPFLSTLLEGFLQNLILMALIGFYYFVNKEGNNSFIYPVNFVFFNIFISWALVFLIGFSILKNYFNLERFKLSGKFKFIDFLLFVNPLILYFLTKIDLFFLINEEVNDSLKEYYSSQKVAEIVQIGSDVLWLVFIPIFIKFKDKRYVQIKLINNYNKINFYLLLFISLILIFVFYLNNIFFIFQYMDNFGLYLYFIFIYSLNNYFNLYYLLLIIARKYFYIFISLIATLFITFFITLIVKYLLDFPNLYISLTLITSYFFFSKLFIVMSYIKINKELSIKTIQL